ncbi:DUF885 domain-containing protein [Stenotrophomonas maltophilia]|mgnify:CR=1 FL=1|jgi:hypothetical protein|uniref:DUF885 domain-containing protein n=1 Tax=Stenotrophomonas maltophilia TaxID=40324 RepID=UPI00074864A2|nr:DUF885 domain-containing protein [Stenotrophomonas maltophilia]OZB65031.1 MAG: hypothetical protein B7X39_14780 [Xanthomonadales bacterium 14-68-21]KUJ03907.1 hypothetical protein AR275_31855 [Stenotrophomonas maltophilia]MBH1476801.1 hypothetical protein [Stenotrophomonas maltophilia]MBH1502318.1 hypothetical protein [Stenotrophomonas maltophilia]HEL7888383.1 hypothetical protein [Stenotrophomonas maltophilia]
MITLNSERGFVRIASWDDIESVPGFTADIDPKTVKLKEIIGSYTFDALIPCGLSTCHQPHGNGFLVAAADGRVTNIGRICGKKHFDVEFTQMSRVFLAAVRAQQSREFLGELRNRLPIIVTEVATIKTEQHGAAWINTRVNQLTGKSTALPTPIINAVRQAVRRGDGTLIIERAATKQEREERSAAVDVKGLEHLRRNVPFAVEDRVGQLDGFPALAPGNGLREIIGSIEPFLTALSEADIESLPDKQLRELSKVGGELDSNLERLRNVVAAGRRLLTRQNIQQLTRFATSSADNRLFAAFLRGLP